ncbi:MAG TPA: protein DA1 [Verrucomicrobiales bacterium]|nr:protein DA1 [Verrucomicrobiales bacterium]
MERWISILMAAFLIVLQGKAEQIEKIAPVNCGVCTLKIRKGTVYQHRHGYYCEACSKLKTRCSLCGIPVTKPVASTKDGRLVCSYDISNVVLDEKIASALFQKTRKSLVQQFGKVFALKNPEVTTSMFDVDYWNKKNGGQGSGALHRIGFSHSRQTGNNLVHGVILLSGQFRDDLRSVCAHEYTHLWINENKADGRKIDPDLVEGICELIAYKLNQKSKNQSQLDKILSNPYTKGQVNQLTKLTRQYPVHTILEWIKTGTGDQLDQKSLSTFNTLSYRRQFGVVATKSTKTTQKPDVLRLTGILKIRKNPIALINGKTFKQNDVKTIKLKSGPIRIRCLKVTDTYVEIENVGTGKKEILKLP